MIETAVEVSSLLTTGETRTEMTFSNYIRYILKANILILLKFKDYFEFLLSAYI